MYQSKNTMEIKQGLYKGFNLYTMSCKIILHIHSMMYCHVINDVLKIISFNMFKNT